MGVSRGLCILLKLRWNHEVVGQLTTKKTTSWVMSVKVMWLTIWAFVALFFCIAAVSCICYTEKCNLSLESLQKYVIAFCLGLLCAMPCLWAPACLLEKHMRENLTTRMPLFRRPVQESAPEEVDPPPHETDPEASLPNYPDHQSPSAPIMPPLNQDGFDAPPSYDAAMRGET